jgi:C4-dicarboxylate-specific signal transduction histidine kinase
MSPFDPIPLTVDDQRIARDRRSTALATRLTVMGELAASLAHEINQPLAAMVTSAEACLLWLERDRPDLDNARKAAQRIVRDGHHAGSVIRGIRTLLGRASPQRESLQLNDLIADVISLVGDELVQHGVDPVLNLCENLPPVMGDRTQLQQVLINLVRNGLESMSDRPVHLRSLQVSTALDAEGEVLIAVSDTGAGFDPALMSRLFEPFFTTKNTGMGLGLWICRSIVESHGGCLWATPREPRGSTFQFTLSHTAA